MQRHDVASTLRRRYIYVMCLLGKDPAKQHNLKWAFLYIDIFYNASFCYQKYKTLKLEYTRRYVTIHTSHFLIIITYTCRFIQVDTRRLYDVKCRIHVDDAASTWMATLSQRCVPGGIGEMKGIFSQLKVHNSYMYFPVNSHNTSKFILHISQFICRTS